MRTRFYISTLLCMSLMINAIVVKAQIISTTSTGPQEIKAFSAPAGSNTMALASKYKIEVTNTTTKALVGTITLTDPITTLCLNPYGTMLYIGLDGVGKEKRLMVWNLVSGFRTYLPTTHKDKILTIAISPDSKWIATGSKDGTIKLYESSFHSEMMTFNGHTDDVNSLAFSPDSKFLLSGSKDKNVILWDVVRNIDIKWYTGHKESVNMVAFSPNGRLIASASDDSSILVWDILDSSKPKHTIKAHQNGVKCISFTPDGNFIASGGSEGRFRLWNYSRQEMIPMPMSAGLNHTGSINFLTFNTDKKLITCSTDKTIKYWNWGFPILSISNLVFEDANKTKVLEGTESAAIKFNIVNSGEGDALKLVFNVTETGNMPGIYYNPNQYAGDIKAHSEIKCTIPVNADINLRSDIATFKIGSFAILSNNPFPLKDTSFTIETMAAPYLVIDSLWFAYPDNNMTLTGKQSGNIMMTVSNKGAGVARNVKVSVNCDDPACNLEFKPETEFGNIGLVKDQFLKISVKATAKTITGVQNLKISLTDDARLATKDTTITIRTIKYEPTLVEEIKETVEDKINAWQKKGKYERTDNYKLRVNERTRETQIAIFTRQVLDSLVNIHLNWALAKNEYDPDNGTFKILIPQFDPFYIKVPNSEAPAFDRRFSQLVIDSIRYTVNRNNFAFVHVELLDTITGNRSYIFDSKELVAYNPTQFNFNFDPISINLPNNQGVMATNEKVRELNIGYSDVDINIPEGTFRNPKIFAVVIGNEDYSSRQPGLNSEVNVDFAENDAVSFKKYLQLTYGIPEEQIKLLRNATYAQMSREINWLTNLAEIQNGEAELVFYFSGHGLPDEVSREGYIIPVDVTGSDIKQAISLKTLYSQLSKWPTKKVTVFLDACFSGGGRNEGLISMKGAKIKPKDEAINGNMVVFTSSTGDESSGFYREKQHGMFTYFLLKKLQQTRGNIDYQSLIDYLSKEVSVRSLISNNKTQNPQIIVSTEFNKPLNQVGIGESLTE